MIKSILSVISFGYGVIAAAGVFTVFVAVGLVPRFAGKTRTAKHILLYEDMIIWGSILGAIVSIFGRRSLQSMFLIRLANIYKGHLNEWYIKAVEYLVKISFGIFGGMFIGCLAIAIAETLDSIPILTRRVKLRLGLRCVIFAMAFGKFLGSIIYFYAI